MYSNLQNQAAYPELWVKATGNTKSALVKEKKVLDLDKVRTSELVWFHSNFFFKLIYLQRPVGGENNARLQHFIECAFMLEPQEWDLLIQKYTSDEVSS